MRVVITAGPTREPFDPVRFLSNRSSGRMGYALARAAVSRGCSTTLISGPVALRRPAGVTLVRIETCADLQLAMREHCRGADLVILCAAVCDFRPAQRSVEKLKRLPGIWRPELEATPDLAAELGGMRVGRPRILVAFAAETSGMEERAAEKLRKKRCDYMVGNDVSQPGIGMDSEWNAVTLMGRDGVVWRSGRRRKTVLARALLERLLGGK